MSRVLPLLLVFLGLAASAKTTGIGRNTCPTFEVLTIPPYPYLARLAGIEATVGVNLTLDGRCNIGKIVVGKGPDTLVDAVTPTVYGGKDPLRFRSCAADRSEDIHLSFVFALQGKPTNEWSPTYTSVTGDGSSFTIVIRTAPADLDALGLERKGGLETRYGVVAESPRRREKAPQAYRTYLTLPSYPVLARTAHVQGDVKIEATLGASCRVSAARVLAGEKLLNASVLDAVRGWRLPSCGNSGEQVQMSFHFELSGADVRLGDDWAPTRIETVRPYEFRIRTSTGDLVMYN